MYHCLLPSAYCITAYCLLPTAYSLQLTVSVKAIQMDDLLQLYQLKDYTVSEIGADLEAKHNIVYRYILTYNT